jgi:hypothetical protein
MEDDAKSISIDGHLYYIKWLEMAGWLVGPRFLISKCGKNNGKNSGAARRHGSSGKPPPTTPVSISTAFETVSNRISQPCADPPSRPQQAHRLLPLRRRLLLRGGSPTGGERQR